MKIFIEDTNIIIYKMYEKMIDSNVTNEACLYTYAGASSRKVMSHLDMPLQPNY